MRKYIVMMALVFVAVSAYAGEEDNYWLYDWTRMIAVGVDDTADPNGQFAVFGQMLISDNRYRLQGMVCDKELSHCIDVTEVAKIGEVDALGKFVYLHKRRGNREQLVQLFTSNLAMIAVFGDNIREFDHAGDFVDPPELDFPDGGVSVERAIKELLGE